MCLNHTDNVAFTLWYKKYVCEVLINIIQAYDLFSFNNAWQFLLLQGS